jgi:hypothetical protein
MMHALLFLALVQILAASQPTPADERVRVSALRSKSL